MTGQSQAKISGRPTNKPVITMALILESSAFENGAEIAARHTCKGDDASSSLRKKPGNRPLLFSREPLIKSGSNKLSAKMFCFKAWNARNSRAIAKFCNAYVQDVR